MGNQIKVRRINTRARKLEISEFPARWEILSGRGLIARILNDELNPNCAPPGPGNSAIGDPLESGKTDQDPDQMLLY